MRPGPKPHRLTSGVGITRRHRHIFETADKEGRRREPLGGLTALTWCSAGSPFCPQSHCCHGDEYHTESSRGSDLSDIMEEDEEELCLEMQLEEGGRRRPSGTSHNALKVSGWDTSSLGHAVSLLGLWRLRPDPGAHRFGSAAFLPLNLRPEFRPSGPSLPKSLGEGVWGDPFGTLLGASNSAAGVELG